MRLSNTISLWVYIISEKAAEAEENIEKDDGGDDLEDHAYRTAGGICLLGRAGNGGPGGLCGKTRLGGSGTPRTLGKPHAPAFPVFLVQLLVNKGAGMVFLVDAIQPNHAAIGVDSGGFGRLIKGAAPGTEIIHVKIVNLAAFFALDSLHSLFRLS